MLKNHNRELEATTSAIREIWSGSCRLSCRQDQQSGLSDNSGLDKSLRQGTESNFCWSNQNQSNTGRSDCICGTCPCTLIEDVYRTCRPATSLYSQSIEVISRGYCNVLRALSDACTTTGRGTDGGVSSHREAEILSIKQFGSADNINFINKTAVKAEGEIKESDLIQSKEPEFSRRKEKGLGHGKVAVASQERQLEIAQRPEATGQKHNVVLEERKETKPLVSADDIKANKPTGSKIEGLKIEIEPSQKKELELNQSQAGKSSQKKEIAFLNDSDATVINQLPKTVAVSHEINIRQSEATKYDTDSESSVEAASERKSCSKCIEKGKICIGSCPKANSKDNKNKL
ncbi:uncharacterized protein LOC120626899 isoform X2 [Pararge aegeria]|uniref:uncharacterized protein LOC120626899 isoform X2 n=1 Tax=Pararge aegeria TaxID=116150 RepID=UPI0019D1091F|nr:uncharacterized protein LOC120626899 isoform X2 [Pararge aegeria]